MTKTKISTIKEYVAAHSIVIFVVVLVAATIHYLVYSQYLDGLHHKQEKQNLEHSATHVQRLFEFHQSIVDRLSEHNAVIDLLNFGSEKDIQQWIHDMQRILPDNLGLALFDTNGNVRSDPGNLKLSDRCYEDMQRRVAGLDIASPPIHYKVKHLAHFDIISNVVNDGKNIGLVFASFNLDIIDRILNTMDDEDHAYKIISADNFNVASSGNVSYETYDMYETNIPYTDWSLIKNTKQSSQTTLIASLMITNIITFILVSGVLFFAIKRLFGLVITDFETLSWMMGKIKNDKFDTHNMPKAYLAETAGVMRFIQHTAEELHLHHKKLKRDSTTDVLTGLHNRRILNENIDYHLQQASAGSEIFVVILDMDHFKQINDQHGHEIGDSILVMFSSALKKCCKKTDICTRVGGDEFIVILAEYDLDDVIKWYKKLHAELDLSIATLCKKLDLDIKYGISAGASKILSTDNQNALFKRADEALYQAKSEGRNKILFA